MLKEYLTSKQIKCVVDLHFTEFFAHQIFFPKLLEKVKFNFLSQVKVVLLLVLLLSLLLFVK